MDSGNDSRLPFEIGSIVAGRYRIDRALADGGMGRVVAATHLNLDQPVALKFLRGDIGAKLDAHARFTREAKAASQLRSEYVARVLDAGVTEDGTPYIAMEYLEGQSLAHILEMLGPLDTASAVEYVVQVCEGLAEAHSRGIVHRDIKPYNLFSVERTPGWNTVKILDFGISKFALSGAGNIATGVILGSPCYMSPEQLRSTATVDHRTDLWSLGATLYELLVGRAAFDASQTLPELVTAILDKPAPRVRDARAEIPAELDAVIDRCLAKDREARFESAGALAAALLPFAPARARIPAERAASMRPAFRGNQVAAGSERPPSVGPLAPGDSAGAPGDTPRHGSQAPTSLSLTIRTDEIDGSKIEARRSPSTARRWLLLASGAAAATLAFVVLLAIGDRGKPPIAAHQVAPGQGIAPREALPSVTLDPVGTEPDRAELVVRASPPFARITIDGKPVANPFVASYSKGPTTYRIVARAWDYEPKSMDVTLTADMIVEIGLDRHVRSTSADSPRAAKRAAADAAAPGDTATKPIAIAVTSGQDLNPAGGRAPLHSIEMKDPYGGP